MSRQLIAILVLAVGLQLAAGNIMNIFKPKGSLSKRYAEINEWLADSPDSRVVLQEAVKHYQATSVKAKEKQAWQTFVGLARITPQNRCSAQSANILETNLALSGLSHPTGLKSCKTIVERVIREMVVQHSRDCEPVYVAKYKDALEELDSSDRRNVEEITNQMFATFGKGDTQYSFNPKDKKQNAIFAEVVFGRAMQITEAFIAAVKNLGLPIPSESSLISDESINYILGSCKSFVEATRDLYAVALFDAKTKAGGYGGSELGNGWVQMNLCESILEMQLE